MNYGETVTRMSSPTTPIKQIRKGYGYWDTTQYPIGGCFKRAEQPIPIVEVLRTFPTFHASNEEGRTIYGNKVAYHVQHTEPCPETPEWVGFSQR